MRDLAGFVLILTGAVVSAAFPTLLQGQEPDSVATASPRPSWVVDGVPDTVWILVERSAAEKDGDRTKELLIEAEREARTAVEACADVGCRFALAVVLGLRANEEGGRTKVRLASDLYEELERILALEPEHPRARHMLGRLHAGIMRMNRVVRWAATSLLGGEALKDASWEEAERHLAFAEKTDPGMLDHHLQLANLYRDTDRPDLALEEVAHVLERTPSSPLEVAVREEAERLLKELDEGGSGHDGARQSVGLPGAAEPCLVVMNPQEEDLFVEVQADSCGHRGLLDFPGPGRALVPPPLKSRTGP